MGDDTSGITDEVLVEHVSVTPKDEQEAPEAAAADDE